MRKALRKKVKVLFRNAGLSPQSSVQNSSSTGQLSPSPLDGNSGKQPQLPSIPYDSDTVVEPPPLSLLSGDNRTGHLSSIVTPPVNNLNAQHPRPLSQLPIYGSSTSAERFRPQNDTVVHNNNDVMQNLLAPRIPENRSGHILTQNPAFHDVQSRGDNTIQAQQVSMESANIYEVHGNLNNYHGNTGPLKQLVKRAMLEAMFDSSARDPPPRCHPYTRHEILQSIQKKVHDPNQKTKMTWMKGGAGVGKSAIMQTIAETEAESNALGASLFFSRPNNRNDPLKVFPTIAYQLAVKIPSYHEYLAQRIALDPSFMSKTMEKQFQDFIVIPFAQQKLLSGHHDRIIVIDGLDECEGSREQCRIIELIHDFASNNPTIPLLWIIASRPEEHLLDAFSEIKACSRAFLWEQEVPIDSEQSVRDVERYLHDEFAKISKRYHRLMPDTKWPSEKQFLVTSRAASGLFIFASTVIRFIDDNENPVYRLNIVTSVIEKNLMAQDLQTKPLKTLDKLYERILSEISSETLSTAKLAMGYFIICPYATDEHTMVCLPSRLFWACNILGLERHVMYGALRKLRSVLSFPEAEDAYKDNVCFLHASFSDYLSDEKRSHIYSVNLDEIATHLWNRFMTILQQWEKNHSYDDIEFSWSPESIMKVMRVKEGGAVPRWKLVDYASFYWRFLLEQHLKSPDTAFHLLLSLEDLTEQLKNHDFSHRWGMSYGADDTDCVIRCLENHADLYKDLIQDLPFISLEKNQFLRSFYERRWSSDIVWNEDYRTLDGKTEQDFGNDFNKLELFLREKSRKARKILDLMEGADSATLVGKVLGSRPSKCRVLLLDVESGELQYCFPYTA